MSVCAVIINVVIASNKLLMVKGCFTLMQSTLKMATLVANTLLNCR